MIFTTKIKLFIASGFGWGATLIISILAWAKSNLIYSDYFIFIPGVYMFLVTILTLIIASSNRRVVEFDKHNPSDNDGGLSMAPFLNDTPKTFKTILLFVFFNFGLSLLSNYDSINTSVHFSYDHYIYTDANNIERVISETEYQDYYLDGMKIFSSATLLFFSFTVIILERLVFWEKNDLWALPKTKY